jgi:hypothetical protein
MMNTSNHNAVYSFNDAKSFLHRPNMMSVYSSIKPVLKVSFAHNVPTVVSTIWVDWKFATDLSAETYSLSLLNT